MKIFWSPLAAEKLEDIYDYISVDNKSAAQNVKEADLSDNVETSTLVEDFPVQFVNYQ